jgi:hypothetical protein
VFGHEDVTTSAKHSTYVWSEHSHHHPQLQDLLYYFWAEFATCRFYDPNRSRGVNHLGFHPTNISAFTSSDKFKQFMTSALDQLDEAGSHVKRQEQYTRHSPGSSFQPRVVCVTYCNKGRHRSVSASQVLQEVLQSEFGAHVFSVFQSCIG